MCRDVVHGEAGGTRRIAQQIVLDVLWCHIYDPWQSLVLVSSVILVSGGVRMEVRLRNGTGLVVPHQPDIS